MISLNDCGWDDLDGLLEFVNSVGWDGLCRRSVKDVAARAKRLGLGKLNTGGSGGGSVGNFPRYFGSSNYDLCSLPVLCLMGEIVRRLDESVVMDDFYYRIVGSSLCFSHSSSDVVRNDLLRNSNSGGEPDFGHSFVPSWYFSDVFVYFNADYVWVSVDGAIIAGSLTGGGSGDDDCECYYDGPGSCVFCGVDCGFSSNERFSLYDVDVVDKVSEFVVGLGRFCSGYYELRGRGSGDGSGG